MSEATERIIHIQKVIKVTPDGIWGPVSASAAKAYLIELRPKPNLWPSPDFRSMVDFYGNPGDESRLVKIEFPYPTYYDGKLVKTTRVHERCADSLLRVLRNIGASFGSDPGVMEEAKDYGGCYCFRKSRSATGWSKHAWGAAIDYDADDNTFRQQWPIQADMPIEIMAEFAKEGWTPAGAFWGYDAMHFQATK